MENARVDGKIILKCIQKMLRNDMIRFHLSQVAGCSAHGNEPPDSIDGRGILE